MQKTIKQIVDETVEYYSADPVGRRAHDGGSCQYKTIDGRMCAVGRCFCDDVPACVWAFGKPVYPLDDAHGLENLLRPEYRGHSVAFWGALQHLHDIHRHWSESGLTEEGAGHLRMLRADFGGQS